MALTLGEKLRQAREERGITISEVAEQTRISALYLECIENNDYKILPGGIFNKGFVKSYAKYVGVDDQEALRDYMQLMSDQGESGVDETKTYRPEVLTDDNTRSTSIPTIIFAIIILGLLAGGIFALVRYWQDNQSQSAANNSNVNKAVNNSSNTNSNSNTNTASTPVSFTGDMKIEVKALTGPAALAVTNDGKKSFPTVTPAASITFDPKDSLKISYSKDQSQNVQLIMNGKQITLPAQPANPKRLAIEIDINKANAAQVFQNGAIALSAPTTANTNTAPR